MQIMDDLFYLSATDLARLIREKTVSSVEVVKAHLSRIEAVNPFINAVVQLTADTAIEEARKADRDLTHGQLKGALHGVPMTIKDSFETRGVLTTAGTKGLAAHVPGQDATVVARLRAAGAILLGKTNTPELTLNLDTENFVYGRTNNPYDLKRSPGGSSGGAAAIVAAGGSPFEIGSDTGGSIRIPSHFCGIAGIKPTAGRVPRTGHIPFLESSAAEAFTQVGPMSRHVEDLALLLPVVSGVDWRDPAVVPMKFIQMEADDLKKLRIAYYSDIGNRPPTSETIQTIESAVSVFADAGVSIREDCPPDMEKSGDLWTRLFLADGGAWVKNLLKKLGTEDMHPSLEWTQTGRNLSISEYGHLIARWNTFRRSSLTFLEHYDVIICPVNAVPATPHDKPAPLNYTFAYNLLGWPVVVVRCGTSLEGMPIGVQVVARPWREDVAIAVALHLEKALGGWQRPPSLGI
jgi:amidase